MTTNDPAREQVILTIRADIVGSVIMVPSRLNVGSARGRGPNNRVLVVQDPREKGELTLTDLRTGIEWLTATVRRVETEEPGQGRVPKASPGNWIVEVAVDEGDAPAGTTRTDVTFKTGLEREPEVSIPVIVSVIPAVVVNPERLRLKPEGVGDRLTGTILAVVRNDLRGQELVVDASSDGIEVRTDSAGPRRYRVFTSMLSSSLKPDAHLTFRVGDKSVQVPLDAPEPEATAAP